MDVARISNTITQVGGEDLRSSLVDQDIVGRDSITPDSYANPDDEGNMTRSSLHISTKEDSSPDSV